ncbi:divergent polysaccharide deacetylase family protein [Brachyspira hyodysenteriae]|uniref:divergent polysaccharide deacetylase family protein n=1 Tax=Brachyspira hyodysenteriae TaxID=159 RepID=UPI0022CE1FEA|nr:divergent polysaccharide deacetylase family protein [Brachyspira hyodysenteriae]MCZ9994808.1 divergent polysaccharide deacetylase family protein [Brachyspira hyodysenteriae]
MEGSDYFGEQTLIRKGMNEDEVFRLLDYSFSKVPYANGMNNHTGSVASSDEKVWFHICLIMLKITINIL